MKGLNVHQACVGLAFVVILGSSLTVVNSQTVAANPNGAKVTATLVAWISSQCEVMIEEMEAIAKQNAESSQFSLVNYLRYLSLYDSLKLIASKPYVELRWVGRKARVFAQIYQSAMDIVTDYLSDLDLSLSKIEAAEPKSKQVGVSKDWVKLYESILYIATHAPRGSILASKATEMLTSSPDNTSDRMRSIRYKLKTHAVSR